MKEINASEFEKEVLNGRKVVLDFYSTECPPCEALAPKFEAMAELYGDKIKFLKVFRQGNLCARNGACCRLWSVTPW